LIKSTKLYYRINGGNSGGGGVSARSGTYPEKSGNRAKPVEEMNA
jgi:hypothetical protein